jgi:uncharacterized protein with von Willebrand factor type A (vWA) domain
VELLGPVRVGITQALDIDATREAAVNRRLDELGENIRDAVECLRTGKTEADAKMADVVCPIRAAVA